MKLVNTANLRSIFLLGFVVYFFLAFLLQSNVSALTQEEKNLRSKGIYYFSVSDCSDLETARQGNQNTTGGSLKGVFFPNADEEQLAKAIDAYIKKDWPKSPLVGYGDKFVTYGKENNVNPLIGVIIAQVEYQFGTVRTDLVGKGGPGQYNFWAVTHNSNASTRFGAYESIDQAMEQHFKLLGGKHASAKNGITYIGPPQNFRTIAKIMNQYAPSFENDTPRYIQTIIDGMAKIGKGVDAEDEDANSNEDELQGPGSCACAASGTQSASLSGNTAAEKAFTYLVNDGLGKGKGVSAMHAAAIIGNFMQESNMNPKAVNKSSGATGIAQWLGGRLTALKASGGSKYLTLEAQLEFLTKEMTGAEKAATTKFLATKTLQDASSTWGNDFERAGASEMNHANRFAQAKIILKKYGAGASESGNIGGSIGDENECTAVDQISVSADGYAFPVGLPKNQITNWGSPWCRTNCHHDGSPAMDIAKKGFGDASAGVSLFAIVDGTIENQKIYAGQQGCYALHIKGKDGYDYWYGHIRKPTKQNGDKVKAGEKIAEIGERKCTGNKSDPHLHIDRGKKGLIGGIIGNRDKGFLTIINKLYDEL